MKRLVLTLAILIGLAAPAWAGFAEGVAAYDRGDYATALREWPTRGRRVAFPTVSVVVNGSTCIYGRRRH